MYQPWEEQFNEHIDYVIEQKSLKYYRYQRLVKYTTITVLSTPCVAILAICLTSSKVAVVASTMILLGSSVIQKRLEFRMWRAYQTILHLNDIKYDVNKITKPISERNKLSFQSRFYKALLRKE